jgi:molybdopterin-guanine dinucleotide biosynthesis protein A
MSFAGAVLTGGAGRRMGAADAPKALRPLAGRPLAAYPLAALRGAGAAELLAVGGTGPLATALTALGYTLVADADPPGQGPLAAIVRVLEVAAEPLVVVLACDTPFVTAATVTRLIAAADERGCVGITGGRLEPLIAAYGRVVRAELAASLERDRSVHRALVGLGLPTVVVDADEAFNVNTPEQLQQAEEWLRAGR